MEIKDLKPNPKNPRKITDKKLKALKKSMDEFGDLSGILFNKRTGQLIGGHQRKQILESVGAQSIDVREDGHGFITLNNGEVFSYRQVDWDENKEKAANIAANKGAGEWDMIQLGEWFKELDEMDFDLDLTMFDEEEREQFFIEPTVYEEGLTDPDSIPENVETRCKPGDLWLLGNHRLLCGDSTDVLQVERLMGGEKADMVFTDPPYGINYDDRENINSHPKNMKNNKFGPIIGDDRDDFFKMIFPFFEETKEQFWFGANYYCSDLPKNGSFIVWSKKTESQREVKALFNSDFELCWSRKNHRQKLFHVPWTGCHNKEKNEDRLHPTQKPILLIEMFFNEWGKGHNIIVDLFLGSGSTLIACEKTKRECYGMEIDPKYCDVILERWEKFTGQTATLAAD